MVYTLKKLNPFTHLLYKIQSCSTLRDIKDKVMLEAEGKVSSGTSTTQHPHNDLSKSVHENSSASNPTCTRAEKQMRFYNQVGKHKIDGESKSKFRTWFVHDEAVHFSSRHYAVFFT